MQKGLFSDLVSQVLQKLGECGASSTVYMYLIVQHSVNASSKVNTHSPKRCYWTINVKCLQTNQFIFFWIESKKVRVKLGAKNILCLDSHTNIHRFLPKEKYIKIFCLSLAKPFIVQLVTQCTVNHHC